MADGYTEADLRLVEEALPYDPDLARKRIQARLIVEHLVGAGRLRDDSDGLTPDEMLRHALAQVETLTYVARRNREHVAELTAIVERVTALTEGLHPEQGILVGDVLTAVNAPVPVVAKPYRAASIAPDGRRPCGECGPGYWIGDEGCQHAALGGAAAAAVEELERAEARRDAADQREADLFACGGFNCPCNDDQPCPDPKCRHVEPAGVPEEKTR